MLSKTAVVAAGVCGTLFLGYCIYFDRKRRSDPKFKDILRDRRAKALLQKKQADRNSKIQLPNLKDYDSVQKFFIQEVQLGEELLSQGDLENGVEHLSTAVAVCGEPAHLVEILEQQLAPHVFAMLMQRLPVISRDELRKKGFGGTKTLGGKFGAFKSDHVFSTELIGNRIVSNMTARRMQEEDVE